MPSVIVVRVTMKPKDLVKKLERAPWILRDALALGVEDLGRQVERRAKTDPEMRVDRGDVRRTTTLDNARGSLTRTIGTAVQHGVFVHEGTRPHYPPMQPLIEWVWRNRRKFGLKGTGKAVREQVFGIAQGIQRKIGRRGTPAHPYLRNALAAVAPRAERIILRYVKPAVERLASL